MYLPGADAGADAVGGISRGDGPFGPRPSMFPADDIRPIRLKPLARGAAAAGFVTAPGFGAGLTPLGFSFGFGFAGCTVSKTLETVVFGFL